MGQEKQNMPHMPHAVPETIRMVPLWGVPFISWLFGVPFVWIFPWDWLVSCLLQVPFMCCFNLTGLPGVVD